MDICNSEIKTIQIGDRIIGFNQPTYIIAEIGINHNGDVHKAKELIDIAVEASADAVKFQKRHLPSLYREDVLTDTLFYEQNFQYTIPILKKVELNRDEFVLLKKYCEEKKIDFLCTPFDIPSVEFLSNLDVRAFKIASADLTNIDLLEYVADKGKTMLVSTGMSYWNEITQAVKVLKGKDVPFALLHCRSVYPVWPREVNLKMITMLEQFGCPVGYSGHDIGITVPLVAASMGACIIEKHITLDKSMKGPDHKISLESNELKRLVRDIRIADQAMGKENRFLLRGEILNRELFGKSLMAAHDIKSGTSLSRNMVVIMGPGKGLSPGRIDDLIGEVINRDVKKGDYFLEEDIEHIEFPDFNCSCRSKWGLISRFSDFKKMLSYNPKVIEFHLAEKDFQFEFSPEKSYSQKLVVHAPEYMGDRLMDLCSVNEDARRKSVQLVIKTIELAQKISSSFTGRPKVVVHAGAMSMVEKLEKEPLYHALKLSLSEISQDGIELLLENLPPYPWYFGGQWKGNYFMDADEIRAFCEETGIRICFDLSHAVLYCNAKEKDILSFIRTIKPFIRHIHFADGYGLDGEGVQIGSGDIDFDKVMPLFENYNGTWVPEIWRGHLQNGKGFLQALTKLSKYNL